MMNLKETLLSNYCTIVQSTYQKQSPISKIIIATTSIAAGIFSFYILANYIFANKVRKVSHLNPPSNKNFIEKFENQILKSYSIKTYDQLPEWRIESEINDLPVYNTDILLNEIKDPIVKNNFFIIIKIKITNKNKSERMEFIFFDIENENEIQRYSDSPSLFDCDSSIFDEKQENTLNLLKQLVSEKKIANQQKTQWELCN